MANSKLLVDTSIIIDFLRKKNKQNTKFWKLVNEFDCAISTITHFELYCGANTLVKVNDIEKIVNCVAVIDFNIAISKIASKLYLKLKKENKQLEFRDLFIAATALYLKIPLATFNIKHFERISKLELVF